LQDKVRTVTVIFEQIVWYHPEVHGQCNHVISDTHGLIHTVVNIWDHETVYLYEGFQAVSDKETD